MSGLDLSAWHRQAAKLVTLRGRKVSANGSAVIDALLFHAGPDLVAWPSSRTIAEESGVHRRTVRRELDRLVADEVLAVVGAGSGRRGTQFRLFPSLDLDELERFCAPQDRRRRARKPAPTTRKTAPSEPGLGAAALPETGAAVAPTTPERVGEPVSVVGAVRCRSGRSQVRPEPTEPNTPLPPKGGRVCSAPDPVVGAVASALREFGVESRVRRLSRSFVAEGGDLLDLQTLIAKAAREGRSGPRLLHDWLRKGVGVWRGAQLDGDSRDRHEKAKREHARCAHYEAAPAVGPLDAAAARIRAMGGKVPEGLVVNRGPQGIDALLGSVLGEVRQGGAA